AGFGRGAAGVVLRRDDAGAGHQFSGALGTLTAGTARLADGVADCGRRPTAGRQLRPDPAGARSTTADAALRTVRADPLAAPPVALALDRGSFQRFRCAARARTAQQPYVHDFR